MPVTNRTIRISRRGGRDRRVSISIVTLYEVYRAYRSSARVREVYYYNIIHDNSLLFRYVNNKYANNNMITYIHDVQVWYGDVPVRYVLCVRGNRLTASNLTPVQKSSTSATCHYIIRHLR